MGIYQRQYEKILAAEMLRYLLMGSLPNLNDISKRISSTLDKRNNVTFKYIAQPYKEVFRNELYNKSLRSIKFDITTFHEELIDLFSKSASRLNYSDLYHKINSYELKNLQSQLEMLLFTVQDADFYFAGAFDTFSDYSKTNITESTKEVIDLSEQCLALPYLGSSTTRVNVDTLIGLEDIDVETIVTDGTTVLSSTKIPSTKFGNIFTDTLQVWGQEVITNTNEPVSIVFTFPFNKEQESEHFVSRFEIIPHTINKQSVTIVTSNDDVNYLSIKGYEQGIVTEDQKVTYAMDFETTLVEYVRLIIKKDQADEEILMPDNTKRYKYLFGLKKFAAYTTGRSNKATYISKSFSFKDSSIIGKVSIDSKEEVPAGCNISYFITAANSSGNPIGSYVPITPVNSPSAIGINKIINFGTTLQNSQKFTVALSGEDAAQAYGSPFQGKRFYRIGPTLTEKPIYGSSLLYRGFKSWYRDSSGSFEIINVSDNYISFNSNDVEALYTTTTETPGIVILSDVNGIRRRQLVLSKAPYFDINRGHSLRPEPGVQNPLTDTKPNYAIYQILKKQTNTRRNQDITLEASAGTIQYLPANIDSFIIQSNQTSDLPVLMHKSGNPVYQFGPDYTFELIDIGGQSRPTGRIVIPTGSRLLDSTGAVISDMYQFFYTPDLDITHKVVSIDGNNVILEHSGLAVNTSIEIVYRYIPKAPSQIIKSSIRVSNLPSTAPNRIFYVEGSDYIIDTNTGAIQRIAGGLIGPQDGVYVQFSYRNSQNNIQTFTTWCKIAPSSGTQIKFDLDSSTRRNKLIVDSNAGEAFYINSTQGMINITNATATPVLPHGWVQFIVRSKSPDTNTLYGNNLIDQVIQLKDINKKKIFKENNSYFDDITAFREPLSERTLNHLKVNTLLSDHSVFAIDTITELNKYYIVVNFAPNETSELYSKMATEDSDETNPPIQVPEDFLFNWISKVESDSAPTKLIVKIDLDRSQDTDGAQTPKVFDYKLRVGS